VKNRRQMPISHSASRSGSVVVAVTGSMPSGNGGAWAGSSPSSATMRSKVARGAVMPQLRQRPVHDHIAAVAQYVDAAPRHLERVAVEAHDAEVGDAGPAGGALARRGQGQRGRRGAFRGVRLVAAAERAQRVLRLDHEDPRVQREESRHPVEARTRESPQREDRQRRRRGGGIAHGRAQ
jgi:hypothetical protein